jgi:hypothetical protein
LSTIGSFSKEVSEMNLDVANTYRIFSFYLIGMTGFIFGFILHLTPEQSIDFIQLLIGMPILLVFWLIKGKNILEFIESRLRY